MPNIPMSLVIYLSVKMRHINYIIIVIVIAESKYIKE